MRNCMRFSVFFLLLCLLAAGMVSCSADTDAPSATEAETSAVSGEASPAEVDFTKEWVIVRSDMDERCLESIYMIRGAFEELFGYKPAIRTDYLAPNEQPGEYEILVGKTTRESCAGVYEGIAEGEYTYQVLSENVIAIFGDSVKNTHRAAERFLRDCFGYTEFGTGTAASVAIGTSYTGKYVPPFQNPVVEGYADPDVLYHDGVYYLYATSYHIGNGYEVLTSTDLVNWENHGNCLDTSSGVTDSWGFSRYYWAPDVEEHNGKFYMLASVDEHLGIMTADSPLGPFVPEENYLFEDAIDGHMFFDGDDMYIYYVTWREGHPYGIWGCKMMDDCVTPDLSTETLLIQPKEDYEPGVTEGPYMLKKDGVYYLTYSGNGYTSPWYCICYATSDSPLGEYVKYKKNPILISDGETVFGTGHHCFTTMPDSEEMLIVYHIHDSKDGVHPRHTSVDRVWFRETKDGYILECDGPNIG